MNIQSQNKAAELFLQHYDFVRVIAFRSAPARHLQEDIIHDAYIEFVENFEKWTISPEGPRPLLRTLVKNVSLRYWHNYMQSQPEFLQKLAERIWSQKEEPEDLESDQLEEKVDALKLCMGKMSPDNRRLLELFYFKEKSADEISTIMQKKTSTIYSLLSRFRVALHDCVTRALHIGISDV